MRPYQKGVSNPTGETKKFEEGFDFDKHQIETKVEDSKEEKPKYNKTDFFDSITNSTLEPRPERGNRGGFRGRGDRGRGDYRGRGGRGGYDNYRGRGGYD